MTEGDGDGGAGVRGGPGSGSVGGWVAFLAVAVFWAPLWFGGFLAVPPDGTWICIVAGLCISTTCGLIRSIGFPLVAWAALVWAAAAAALWSLAVDLYDLPDDPWSGYYQLLTFGKAIINLFVLLLFIHLLRRRARGTAR